MFYFLISSLMTYNFILLAAAVIPAVVLMVKVYRSDRLEPESPSWLWALMRAGILSSLIALVAEYLLNSLLDMTVSDQDMYMILLYFGVVAFSEEGAKYFMLHRYSWNSGEFNCQYDGVVYAVFVSLGFALWENISYVLHYGFSTAVIRAVTAIPGHACFGVFMGVFYGIARKYANRGNRDKSVVCQVLAVLVPAALHGAYDYIASIEGNSWYFVGFIALMFVLSYFMVFRSSKLDQYIGQPVPSRRARR